MSSKITSLTLTLTLKSLVKWTTFLLSSMYRQTTILFQRSPTLYSSSTDWNIQIFKYSRTNRTWNFLLVDSKHQISQLPFTQSSLNMWILRLRGHDARHATGSAETAQCKIKFEISLRIKSHKVVKLSLCWCCICFCALSVTLNWNTAPSC